MWVVEGLLLVYFIILFFVLFIGLYCDIGYEELYNLLIEYIFIVEEIKFYDVMYEEDWFKFIFKR